MEEPVIIQKSSMEQQVEVFQEIISLGHMKNGVHNLVENIQVQPLGNEQVLLSIGAKQGTGIGLFIGVIARIQIGTAALWITISKMILISLQALHVEIQHIVKEHRPAIFQ